MKHASAISPYALRFGGSLFAAILLAASALPLRAAALYLDGNGSYVTFLGANIPFGNEPFTIEAWINPTTIPTGGENGGQITFWGNQTANQANGFRLRGPSGVRHYFWSNDHDANFGMDILPDTTGPNGDGWHHLALTYNGSQTVWYWNGNVIGTRATAAGVSVAAVNHRIGCRLGAEFFHGYIDEIRIWNRARSGAEISANMNYTLYGTESNLVAYFDFEGDLGDRAGGDNNGTFVGNAMIDNTKSPPIQALVPRIFSFTTTSSSIYYGSSVTLSWAVSNALSVAIEPGIGAVSPTNSLVVSPTNTTTYLLTASNSFGSRSAMLTIQVDPGIPVAQSLSTNLPMNGSLALTLRGSDPNNGTLTYYIVTPPAHGTLSGTPPAVTYTPDTNFYGWDTFTFKVNDGTFDSLPAAVSLKVISPPAPPVDILLSSTNISSQAGPGSIIGALRAVDPNDTDTHTYQLVAGGPDNAIFILTNSILLAGSSYLAGPGATFTIRVRATDNTGRSLEKDIHFSVVDVPLTVVINEIHYNGADNTVRDSFIELHNPLDTDLDLSLWRVRGGLDYVLPAGSIIPARGFLVLAENPAVMQSRYGVTALGPWAGGIRNEGEEITLRNPVNEVVDRVGFKSEFPWPIAANGDGPSMQLVHPGLDNDLGSSWRSALPTPGTNNSVYATNAAPNIRQVNHAPKQPASTNSVTITCKVTDPEGVAAVTLAYQIVTPGNYLPATLPLTANQLNNLNATPTLTNPPNPAFEAETNWTTVAMHDDGLDGDAVAGDNIYTVVLPPQANRTLVRYRITCTDVLGAARRAPFEDDPSLNFAYFVYDGIPAYLTYSPAVLQTLPVYTLITRDADMNECAAWFSPWSSTHQLPQDAGGQRNSGRLYFNWEGAMVYDGVVYDHIKYRLRGANGRYHPGKRSFRFKFNAGHYLDAKDQDGKPFPVKWRELTTGKGQSNRGSESFALNEVVNFFLFNKVGVPAPATFHFHFRVIDGPIETPADQYAGDFWGLNWAQEEYDAPFFDAHNLPKGNLYKLVDNYVLGIGELRYQGPFAVTNAADFFNIENNLTGFQSQQWLEAHVNYRNWYRYHAIAEAIRHYDVWPSCNKNGAWYFEPIYNPSNSFYGRMWLLPYDTTDTWGPTWNGGQDVLHNGIFNDAGVTGGDSGENLEMQKEYRNVVREIRDLLFQPDQINAVIDAFAGPLKAFAAADQARWTAAPAPASYSSLLLSGTPGAVGGLTAYAQDMKNFMFVGGTYAWWVDRNTVGAGGWVTRLDALASDGNIPTRPTITYVGTNGYPVDGLVFKSSAFADPNGAGTFAAMQWRVAEVLPTNAVVTNVAQLRLEWDAVWDSGEITTYNEWMAIPSAFLQPEHLYRARVRHKDNTGRWSQWSAPIQFRPKAADVAGALRSALVISEIMYNPPGEPFIDGDEFEYLELKNAGPNPLDLSGLYFSNGIDFAFTNGTLLAPGQLFLLARNPAMLAQRYPGGVVNGVYSGKLDNTGETLAIAHPVAGEVLSVTYSDRAPWPAAADGLGFSLVLADAATGLYGPSAQRLGSPGVDAAPGNLGGVVINEVLSASTLPLVDTIELFNPSTATKDISGWWLTDDPAYPWKFRIPTNTVLAPGGYAIFDETAFNPTPGVGTSFRLNSFGDEVYLFSANAAGELTGYSHGFSFGAAQDGVAFGRHVNSVGEEQFPAQIARSFATNNPGPRFGPVVITEIHYHPALTNEEFLEIQNTGTNTVLLYDEAHPTNTWQINGAGFAFPSGVALPPGGVAIVCADAPETFRARFGLPPELPIFQYPGALQGGGERLELLAPDAPTTNGVPYYVVDAVRYNDRAPWPRAADGAGASLQRRAAAAYGDDPANWLAAVPTPGGGVPAGDPPVITTQPQASAGLVSGTATLSVTASGTPPLHYQWRFQGANLPGATNATLVLGNLQLEQAGNYAVSVFNQFGSADSSNATLVVRYGPTITLQPTNIMVRVQPDPSAPPVTNVTFTVAAVTMNPPLTYQWYFNGVPVAGATNTSFTITNVQISSQGTCQVVVSDTVGGLPSALVNLTPVVRPVFTAPPVAQTVPVGGQVTLSAATMGYPLPITFEWTRLTGTGVTNVVNAQEDFWNFTASNVATTYYYRVTARNLAGSQSSSAIAITTLADNDGDGLPDNWEAAYNLSSATPDDRNLDSDGDGASNWEEYVAGTNPTNAASVLRLELTVTNQQAGVVFQAISNRTYSVLCSDQVPATNWQRLGDVVARATNRVYSLPDPGWNTNRFFRVVTPWQPLPAP